MTASNHIAGGTVFTGIFASLWDINIFSDSNYLVICLFASLLPDIDHTRSPIGKLFYPISKYLDKKFGHRTITHSLVFVFITYIIAYTFLPYPHSTIFLLALISHLIFDMMTVQGVPLFYPFKKNPCVLPGNPEARIRSGNTRAELTAFVLFIICGTFCYPLMANGFWMTFNKTLGSQKQLVSEFKRSDKILLVEYSFRRDFEHYSGVGYCLAAKEGNIVFLDTLTNKFVHLTSDDVPKFFVPHFSQFTSLDDISTDIQLVDFSIFQLDSILKIGAVISANIFTNNEVNASMNGNNSFGQHFTGEYLNEIILSEAKEIDQNIKIKKIQLQQLNRNYNDDRLNYKKKLVQAENLKEEYKQASDYRKLEINNLLTQINPQKPDQRKYKDRQEILKEELKYLKEQNKTTEIFGNIKIIQI